MKAPFNFALPLILIAFATGCSSGTTTATETSANNEKILAAVNGEPKVKDSYINDAGVLYVQVADDGTRRDGYAEYLCQLAKDNGGGVSIVRVMQVNTFNDPNKYNAFGVLLGESSCQ